MGLRAAIYNTLNDDATLTAAVAARVYPGFAPASATRPYVTFQIISDGNEQQMTAPTTLAHALVQVDCWSESSVTTETVANAVRGALSGVQHTVESTSSVEISAAAAEVGGERETIELSDDGSQTQLFRTSIDFSVWYRRA